VELSFQHGLATRLDLGKAARRGVALIANHP
jgi:hypothetical protein